MTAKQILLASCMLVSSVSSFAQKAELKDDKLTIDGTAVAQVKVEKGSFGLTRDFEVSSLAGKKLIIAVPATEFEQDKNDNSTLYYRFTFLTSNEVAIFKLSALGQQKAFIKLIGTSGIFEGDSTNHQKVKEFIAKKSSTPRMVVDYTPVSRNRIYPVNVKDNRTFEQEDKTIGRFEPKGEANGVSFYDIFLPNGVLAARVSFSNGNNAQSMDLFTAKDKLQRNVPMPKEGKVIAGSMNGEKNWMMLERVAKWMVEKNYM